MPGGYLTSCKQNAGASRLLFVRRIYKVARRLDREQGDLQDPSFERLDLLADKAVAEFGAPTLHEGYEPT
jgi:hypothetical protein